MKNKTIPKDWEIYDENNPEHNDPSLYEVTEWSDELWSDGRRPDSVQVGTIEEDAMRRDFTINSLYLNPWTGEIHDPTGRGLEDLKNRIIRFNGKASDRIKEDFLRVFRAYRQAYTLNFTIEKNTLKNMRRYFKEACEKLPPERIRTEIEKFNPRPISS